ncbi:MAG TPA: hypothetical protein VH796_09820 [Nitrososphaeraceae archaeon]
MNEITVSNSIQQYDFSFSTIGSKAFAVLLKLSPRRYKYNAYMISPVDVLFRWKINIDNRRDIDR